MIENDPEMYMHFTQMFEQQAPFTPPIGSGDIKLKNYHQMLVVLNHVLTSAPEFNTTGMVGCPINAVLDFPMITRAGLAAFLSPKVNAMLKKVLKVWTEYLDSAASRSRALIFIEADGPIGLMCLIPVGMAEVSSCVT